MPDLHRRPEGILKASVSEGILNEVKASFTQSRNRSTEMSQQRGLCLAILSARSSISVSTKGKLNQPHFPPHRHLSFDVDAPDISRYDGNEQSWKGK